MFVACAKPTASQICSITSRRARSSGRRLRWIAPLRSVPSSSSMAMKKRPESSPKSWTTTIFGCVSLAAEALPLLVIAADDDLEGDGAVEHGVMRAIHLPHRACADPIEQAVFAQGHGCCGRHGTTAVYPVPTCAASRAADGGARMIPPMKLDALVLFAVPTANPILFVTQVPEEGDFTTIGSTFGNHSGQINSAPRGGDLWI